MYNEANVTGPSEFGELPLQDQVFWNAYIDEKARRQQEENEKVESEVEEAKKKNNGV